MHLNQNYQDDEDGLKNSNNLLDQSKAAAYEDLLAKYAKQDEEVAKKILGQKMKAPFEDLQTEIKEARRPRMRTVEHYLCDHCDKEINKPTAGFIIQGNIYLGDPGQLGGLIGNNIPEPDQDGKIALVDLRKTVLCVACLLKALHPTGKPTPVFADLMSQFEKGLDT